MHNSYHNLDHKLITNIHIYTVYAHSKSSPISISVHGQLLLPGYQFPLTGALRAFKLYRAWLNPLRKWLVENYSHTNLEHTPSGLRAPPTQAWDR